VRDDTIEVWRDPTGGVAIVEVPLHSGWIGRSVRALEEATGARVGYVQRFGVGALPTRSMALQDGDQVFMLLTDEMIDAVTKITSAPPEEKH
jgi:trk system potassium uptake protein